MSKVTEKASPPSVDAKAVEPGCPHCGSALGHPTSSRSISSALAPIQKPKQKTVPVVVPAAPVRPDGQFAYELFVTLMGRKETAVVWDKLTQDAKRVWDGVARGVEEQVIAVSMHAQFGLIKKEVKGRGHG